MSYMNYLSKCQKWIEKGSIGNLIEDNVSEHSSEQPSEEEDIDEGKT